MARWNLILFQLVWLAIAGSSAQSKSWLYWLLCSTFIFSLIYFKKWKLNFLDLGLLTIGITFDFIMVASGSMVVLKSSSLSFLNFPDWLLLIWLAFMTVNEEFIKLIKKLKFLQGVIYSVGATLSYFAAIKFELIAFNSHFTSLYYLIFWYIFYQLSVKFYNKRNSS